MPAPQTDIDVVDVIDGAVGSLSKGVNLFAGPTRDYSLNSSIPHRAVFVLADGGDLSSPIKGTADERHPYVSIRVRSDPESSASAFQLGQVLAREVYDAIDQSPPAGYIDSRTLGSQPTYIGPDDDGHHEWLITVSLTVDV